MNDEEKFAYKYNAPTAGERREIESIKRQYSPSESDVTVERLRKLDARVKRPPKILAGVLATAGILVFGLGLTMILEWSLLVWGIVVMCPGCALMASAYPVHKFVLEKNKRKYGDEIVRLSKELLNEDE